MNSLSYESKVSEVLSTEDGSSLDADCVRCYTDTASDKASFMAGEIQKHLLVSGCSAIVQPVSHTHSLTFVENQVLYFKSLNVLHYRWQIKKILNFVCCFQVLVPKRD